MNISIIIKALNEEKSIARAIESALAAVAPLGGEVILADSHSTDNTVSIAQTYPIRIVQLANPEERCCGIGPQLGYQVAQGEFIYILDGDMQMLPDFLPQAINFMQENPQVAGIAGNIIEMNTTSLEYVSRNEKNDAHRKPGIVDRLDGGGLYRKSAIESVGYFSNRNLHSYEELDLAVRLRQAGWKLHRIDVDAVRHWGHDIDPYQLLLKRWKSGYINGLGEMLKAAWGKPHFTRLILSVRELRIYVATLFWWIILTGLLLTGNMLYFVMIGLLPLALMTWKKKSINKAVFSIVSWNMNAAGLLRGFFKSQKSPLNLINVKE